MQYGLAIPWQLTLFLELTQSVREQGVAPTEREEYQRIADGLKEKIRRSGSGRNVLLHLLFPDRYERIASDDHKHRIVAAFAGRAGDGQDEDERLLNIRRSFEKEPATEHFDFYDEDVRPLWDSNGEGGESTGTRFWVEKTKVAGRPDRVGGKLALGKALWSPQRSRNGGDVYRFMREVSPGDVVLHLTDNRAFTGVSRAAGPAEEFGGLAGTEWGEQPSYRIRLSGFTPLDPQLSREIFFSNPYLERLVGLIDAGKRHLFYNRHRGLNQGAYLTPAPPELVRTLNDAYKKIAGGASIPMVDLVDQEAVGHDEPLDERQPAVPHPLNLVLYGPPGTGKTYSVQRRALKVLGENPEGLSPGQIGERFRAYLREGRAEFVTFHPSYSYEEFVEGYRYDEDAKVPKLHKGVFRRLVEQALSPARSVAAEGARIWKVSLGGARGEDVFDRCIREGEVAIGWLEDQDLEGRGREDIAVLYRSRYGTAQATNSINSINYLVNEMSDGDYVAVLKDRRHVRAIGVVKGDYRYKGSEYQQHRPHTRPVEWLDTTREHDVKRLNEGKSLVQQTVYPLDRIPLHEFVRLLSETNQEREPYVLVIDEINRGNVSRIFGELITLLEGDKRLGAPNEFSVRLPYSNQTFGVPTNLHVIGTMNTADRSIALIDSALRRRFDFEEMMPDVGVVRSVLQEKLGLPGGQHNEHVDLVCGFLEALNRRIAVLFDRDHQVGHSYLLDATDAEGLHRALYGRVFPLLQEYFYNDFERLQRLLGRYDADTPKGFVHRREDFRQAFGEGEVLDEELPWEFFVYPAQQLTEALRNTFLPPRG